ncbi:SDR family oxidoreductase [Streptomyces sp. RK62]|nr:SDR family oxidoreductase [Streptomyces sp. RK62]
MRVNTVSPGPVRTEGTVAMLGDNAEVMNRTNVRGKVGEPEEIAEIVSFLAGPASSYVNGAVLIADGGELSALPG